MIPMPMPNSEIKIVVVTGPPGIGKTTFIKNIVRKLNVDKITCCGFVTDEIRSDGRRIGFDINTLDGKNAKLARIKEKSEIKEDKYVIGNYIVDVRSFECVALPIFSQFSEGSVIVLDEIGKMEMFSRTFVAAVQKLLSTHKCLLISIPIRKGPPIPLVENIRNHPKTHLFELTKVNRDDLSMQERIISIMKG